VSDPSEAPSQDQHGREKITTANASDGAPQPGSEDSHKTPAQVISEELKRTVAATLKEAFGQMINDVQKEGLVDQIVNQNR
jgi:hypothetical protein